MGQEIEHADFSDEDRRQFEQRLRDETHVLRTWFDQRRFSPVSDVAGFELEAWLIDDGFRPCPGIEDLLAEADDPLVVPELSKFNAEFNCPPMALKGSALADLEDSLDAVWTRTRMAARARGMDLAMIGILPTVRGSDMTLENMAPMNRYHALNRQILKARSGKPITLDIEGREHHVSHHEDVMTEAAATSFQIHLQVSQDEGVRFYNAAKIASAPLVAAAANSPFLFGNDLWEETRIPLFEQSVSVNDWDYAERVTFGVSYLDESLVEAYSANLKRYPVLLPRCSSDGADSMDHLRLHNGTIWRWNRPLLGFDDAGQPHLRIEHRCLPAGPTVTDCIANAAFFYGLVYALARRDDPPEYDLLFKHARDNFYAAARTGMAAEAMWLGGQTAPLKDLILNVCLPLAEEGLGSLDLDAADCTAYLGIIRDRVASEQTGAAWQRGWIAKNGKDFPAMLAAYCEHQNTNAPVHTWVL